MGAEMVHLHCSQDQHTPEGHQDDLLYRSGVRGAQAHHDRTDHQQSDD
jgi:hypothetical protein